jgi:RHS repeat-associated protein
MKKEGMILILSLILLLCGTAFSYDLQILPPISLAENLTSISVDPETDTIAAASSSGKTLFIINAETGKVAKKIPLNIKPSGVVIDTVRNQIIISSSEGKLIFIDIESGKVLKTISIKKPIHSIALNAGNNALYIGNSQNVMMMDLEKGQIIKETSVPNAVADMAVDSNLGYLVVLAENKNELFIYDLETLNSSIAINPSTHIAVLTNSQDNSITIVSLEGDINSPFPPLKVRGGAEGGGVTLSSGTESGDVMGYRGVAIDPTSNIAYISHNDGIAVIKLENPVPQITSLVPRSARSGDSGFRLSVEGSKFIKDSQTQFDTKDTQTSFSTNEYLQAEIPHEALTTPGNVPVTVTNPYPGGGISNTLTFKIYNPAPVLDSISPDIIPLTPDPSSSPPILGGVAEGRGGNWSFTLRARGKNFFNGSVISLNGENLKTKFISSILLEAEVSGKVLNKIGEYPVLVINPMPGSFTSNAKTLKVVDSISDSIPQSEIRIPQSETGSLMGRILNTNKQPIEGVTIQIKDVKTETDADGYFLLKNIPAGRRVLIMHGSSAKEPDSHYPTIPLTVDIQAGVINEMPFQPYLHRQKNRNFKQIDHEKAAKAMGNERPDFDSTGDIIVNDTEVPGVELRIPRGVKITGWDGKENLKVSIRTVPIDRLPVKPLPKNANARTVYMFYFDKVGGGTPDQPIPFKAPNDLGLLPGEKAILWYYDESPNEGEAPNDWAIAGTGTVTPDGKYIVTDEGVGIPKFCCGATAYGGSGVGTGKSGPGGYCSLAGDPVDVTTGYFMYEYTDLRIPGLIPVNITRYYRSRESGSATQGSSEGLGAFGKGTSFEYDWWLGDYGTELILIKPNNYQYQFWDKDGDQIFTNSTDPALSGAKIINNGDSTRTLTTKDGTQYKFDYKDNMSGWLIEIKDKNGNKLTLTRRTNFEGGSIKKITTQEGRTITFNQIHIGIFNRTNSIVDDATGKTVNYTYETDPFSPYPRLKTVTYSDTSSIQYEYDPQGRMSGVINKNGIREVFNVYNSDNRVTTQTHADGGVYTFNYTTASGNITETSMTAPNGAVTTWRFYDDSGAFRDQYLTQMTTSDGITKYEREPGTNLIKKITEISNINTKKETSYTYYTSADFTNPNDIRIGLTKTITDNVKNVTTYEYEPVYGMPAKITNALGKDTTYTYAYDDSNRITKTEIRDPLQTADPALLPTVINYNLNGLPESITDPDNNTTLLYYENTGKPTELTKIIDPLNNISKIEYDSLGRQNSTTDAKGKTTSYKYDAMDRITEVMDPLYHTTQYSYDLNGNLLSVIDPKSNMLRYEYDDRNRIKKMTDQLGKVETYEYYRGTEIIPTTGDNLKSITDRKGQITTFNEYDPMGRIKKITYHDDSYVAYEYDEFGRLKTINDSISGAINYTYSDTGCSQGCSEGATDKIASETTPLGSISYTYDALGRRKTMQVAGQPVVNYEYYDNNLPKEINQIVDSVNRRYYFEYYSDGTRKNMQYFKGTNTMPLMTTTYSYDNANRLTNLLHKKSTTTLENLIYQYDPNGNRTNMNRSSVTLPSRDPVTSASYDNKNEMLTFVPQTGSAKNIVYDDNGNMTSVTNSCGTTTYSWDVRNRLVGINGFTLTSASTCTALSASFKYDALGRRYQKVVNGVITKYIYDGLDIIQEKNANGVVTANYIRTLNIDEPLARIKSGGTIRQYKTDALGSVIALTDDTGVVKTTYSYDPFGNVTAGGAEPNSDNPFQYTGRENDGTGLYYYRARYYSPELQRFISEDPIRDGNNYFVYAANNPLRYTDPMGLLIWICNRKAEGIIGLLGGNHAYLWNDRPGPEGGPCGMRGSSGSGGNSSLNDKGPFDGGQCRQVPDSEGKEDEIMRCCKETANKWPWFPPANDCHEAADDCIKGAGLKNPGAPGGRVGKPCDPCGRGASGSW